MFSNSLSACVLAISLASAVATPAAAGSNDLGRLTNVAAYTDVISGNPSGDKFTDVFSYVVPESPAAETATLDVAAENTRSMAGVFPSTFAATLSPDPETTSIAMLLAGLGLIITTARRRTAHR